MGIEPTSEAWDEHDHGPAVPMFTLPPSIGMSR
jgi:hypothetical protein